LRAELGASHPYPLELDLPPWVISGAQELRRWLFSWGAGLSIEAPAALQAERLRWLQAQVAHSADQCDAVAQTNRLARKPVSEERKRLRIRKRLGPAIRDASKRP